MTGNRIIGRTAETRPTLRPAADSFGTMRTANARHQPAARGSYSIDRRNIWTGVTWVAATAAETAGSLLRPGQENLTFCPDLRQTNLELALQNFEERELNAPPFARAERRF
jgi:hypothetical protein